MLTHLNYFSEGSGIPLFFQHGLTANILQVEKLLTGLDDVRLISMDCPGHGRSLLQGNYSPSFANYADDVVRLTEELDIPKAIFGGLSMGSGIVLNIALRYPERVEGLILLRPAWLDQSNPSNLGILLAALPYMDQKGACHQFEKLSVYRLLQSLVPGAAQSVLGIFSDQQQPSLPRVIEHMAGDKPFESMAQLESIRVPCLILANEDDPLHPYKIAEKIHERIGGATLHKITSRYIDPQLYRTQVREHISAFIKEIKSV